MPLISGSPPSRETNQNGSVSDISSFSPKPTTVVIEGGEEMASNSLPSVPCCARVLLVGAFHTSVTGWEKICMQNSDLLAPISMERAKLSRLLRSLA